MSSIFYRTSEKSRPNGSIRNGSSIVTRLLFIAIVISLFAGRSNASSPVSGTISPTGANITWTGTLTGTPPAANGEPTCNNQAVDPAGNCDTFTLTVTGVPSDWIGKRIDIRFTWASPSTDYDMVVRQESNGTTGLQGDGVTSSPPLDNIVGTSGNGTNTFEEVVISPADTGVGVYYIRAIYFAPNPADQYQGIASVFNVQTVLPTGNVVPPTFDNYQPPVGYNRRDDSPEPSIGVNWNTGNVMTMSRLNCNRTVFDDSTSPADPVNGAIWSSHTSPAIVTGLDPILFTDPVTGRTICGELNAGYTNGIISDDDLTTSTASFQSPGPTSGADHETIGGGPPKLGITGREPTGSYPHMVYYASQDIATATMAASLDGGLNYLPAVPMYTLAQCTGIHGHIKVGPDGTVFVPNRNCGGKAGVAVSEDNGLNWSIRTIPTSSGSASDPSIGIGAGGRIFEIYCSSDNRPHVAVSDDKGLTWRDDNDLSLGVTPHVRAAVFPEAVAGDNGRAAVFFLGTDSTDPLDATGTDNSGNGPNFKGTWFPYIAETNDGGRTWTVVRADNDPLHPGVTNPAQQGVICLNGTTCPGPPTVAVDTRNLADFNEMTVDNNGRVLAIYADGCNFDNSCINVTNNTLDRTGNQGVARLTIIRQRGGTRLFEEFDAGSPSIPLPPFVEVKPPPDTKSSRRSKGISLLWGTPDDHGSHISQYRIYRGKAGGGERLVATVKYGVNTYIDQKGKNGNYYHVTAVNKYGESRKIAKTFVKGG